MWVSQATDKLLWVSEDTERILYFCNLSQRLLNYCQRSQWGYYVSVSGHREVMIWVPEVTMWLFCKCKRPLGGYYGSVWGHSEDMTSVSEVKWGFYVRVISHNEGIMWVSVATVKALCECRWAQLKCNLGVKRPQWGYCIIVRGQSEINYVRVRSHNGGIM